jgi:16S rRNA (cytidine1402-2'-O)-methyltransferase
LNIDPSPLIRAAEAAAGAQGYPEGALYVVATPIGNLADLTLRGIHVLSLVDAIACEDTRNSAALLRHLGLSKPLLSVHTHNEAAGVETVLGRLAQGQRVAYISDAGTPAISDPGALLVAGVRGAGHRVIPIPGANSAAAALSVAGDAKGQGFVFAGFLPAKGQARAAALKAALEGAALTGASLVLFEAPHRIETLMDLLAACAPQRQLTLCRELTKQFETVMTWVASDAPEQLHRLTSAQRRGEFVIVVHAADRSAEASRDALSPASRHVLALLVQELPLKQAVALAVGLTGESRNALYQAALALKSSP